MVHSGSESVSPIGTLECASSVAVPALWNVDPLKFKLLPIYWDFEGPGFFSKPLDRMIDASFFLFLPSVIIVGLSL